ncbi:nucleoside deaminase [Flexibacterium corallicola]|uniref:nucleoside deaminase n=1 Tax=Flexibacterium corallicola TaxID=3037259 RepID=UPI00286EBA02|nr:nucleoside deaminase [Pseudovibrio sp. M1P-2-3]
MFRPTINSGFMDKALEQARLAQERGEVPIGCVVVKDGVVIAADGNRTIEMNDPTAHAEVLAIRSAGTVIGSQRLEDCDLYVTLEPCPMCAAAISFARIRKLFYGAGDAKGGAVDHGVRFYSSSTCHHKPDVYQGHAEEDCADILKDFFLERRS